jgi:predicted nucleic acid-binding protein
MLADVNLFLYAFRRDAERHDDYRDYARFPGLRWREPF